MHHDFICRVCCGWTEFPQLNEDVWTPGREHKGEMTDDLIFPFDEGVLAQIEGHVDGVDVCETRRSRWVWLHDEVK